MGKTTRKHEAMARKKKRGPKNIREARYPKLKSPKQERTNTRVTLRKDWL